MGSYLRTVFDTASGPNQWDEAKREKIASQCNDELAKQGEPRVYSAAKLHAWVGNSMYRHRQSIKKVHSSRHFSAIARAFGAHFRCFGGLKNRLKSCG